MQTVIVVIHLMVVLAMIGFVLLDEVEGRRARGRLNRGVFSPAAALPTS